DWWNYGGLTRSVDLLTVPETFVRGVFLQPRREAPHLLKGWVELDGPQAPRRTVTVEIPELGLTHEVTTDDEGRATLSIHTDLEAWSPENPKLYEVRVCAGDDTWQDTIGFRTVEVRDGDILLNGQPIFLRGISIHEEAPGGGRRAHSRAHAETLLGHAKELGCNFVR